MAQLLVLVLVPVSKGVHHLDKTVESLLKQNFQTSELILAENDSSKNVTALNANFDQSNLRIKSYNNKKCWC